jgi:hypothetical protein
MLIGEALEDPNIPVDLTIACRRHYLVFIPMLYPALAFVGGPKLALL